MQILSPLCPLSLLCPLLISCSDSTGSSSLDNDQKPVLAELLVRDDPTNVDLSPYAKLLANTLSATGAFKGGLPVKPPLDTMVLPKTLTTFTAVGLQVSYDVTKPSGAHFVGDFTEIVAWNDINPLFKTVEEMLAVGAVSDSLGPLPNATYQMNTVDDPAAFALYAKRPSATYAAATGTFTLTSTSFRGPSSACGPVTPGVTCEFVRGTMDAAFSFTAVDPVTSQVYSQPRTVVTGLPAVRLVLTAHP